MSMGRIFAVAEFERDCMIDRGGAAINRAKAAGKTSGTPTALMPEQEQRGMERASARL